MNTPLTRFLPNIPSKKVHTPEQSQVADIISYESLTEHQDYLMVDDRYIRVLYVAAYPFVAHTGWLQSLYDYDQDIDISYHIEPIAATFALAQLQRKVTELESTRRTMVADGKIVGPEITEPLQSAEAMLESVQRGQEQIFQFSIIIGLEASSLELLQEKTTRMERRLASQMFFTKTARYQQLKGLDSILPKVFNKLQHKRNLHSSAAALTFPFASSELLHDTGVVYGVNAANNSLIVIDRYHLPNANSITFAQSGAGKSYASKIEILRQRLTGTQVIVIDPESEYQMLCQNLSGERVSLAPDSKHRINVLDGLKSPATIQYTTELLAAMAGGLSVAEVAIVDKALLFLSNAKNKPLLTDFATVLCNDNQHILAERFSRYTTGSLAKMFNAETNVSLDNPLVVFDIKGVPDSVRPLMMAVVASHVQQQVFAATKKRLLVVDEAWMMMQDSASAQFLSGLVRRARKYYLGVSVITQQADDFLQSEYGQVIASQSALRFLLRQDTTTIRHVVEAFNLSQYEKSYLLNCASGEAIVIADHIHVATKFTASASEHPLLSTSPNIQAV